MPRESDKINLDQIAKMFKLPTQEDIDESNLDYASEARSAAEDYAAKEGRSAKAVEKAGLEAEREAMDEVFRNYHGAVMAAADHLFEKHALGLVPVRKSERYPYEFRIQPLAGETWSSAAKFIVQTIDGVGMFEISPDDYRGSKAREFVLSHYGHIRYWPEVYGEASAQRIYDRSWR